jgi:Carboxypeptidase regulatory-like domain/TonB dependent receptor
MTREDRFLQSAAHAVMRDLGGEMKTGFVGILVLWIAGLAYAQTSTGSLTGLVEDQQQSVIAEANIVVTNIQTNAVLRVQTSSAGLYSVSSLQPGEYRITVEKAGFERAFVGSVQIETGTTRTVNVQLRIGATSTAVEVQAPAEMLSLNSPTLSSVADKKLAQDIPYPERSALELATLTPGVQGDPQYSGGIQSEVPGVFTQPITPGGSLAISGGRPGSASQLVDGFDVTLSGYPRAGVTFSADSIHEVTVQENGLPAQYGRTGGGIINQSTASGTSQYHGSVSWRHIDPFLEVNTFGSASPPNRHQNLFGATFGGPVPLPSMKQNTFFFTSVEPLRATDKNLIRRRVATPDELQGRFHNSLDLLDQTILKTQGYAAALAAPRVGGIYYQFNLNPQGFPIGKQLTPSTKYVHVPNDDISAQVMANPVAQFLNSLQPTPSNPGLFMRFLHPDGSYDSDGNNALTDRAVTNTDNRYNIRVDHDFRDSDHVFVRYTRVPVSGIRYDFFGPSSPANQIATDAITSQNAAINYTRTFGGSRVNELRVSYLRSDRMRGPTASSLNKDYGAMLGLTPAVLGAGFPTFAFGNGLSSIGSGGNQPDGGRSLDVNFGVGDDFSMLLGKHTIKFGGEWRALQLNRFDTSNLYGGQYSFNRNLTNSGSNGGSSLATFDLGLISGYAIRTPQPFYYRWKYLGLYIQDDWKVLPKFTLNFGMRYNLETPRKEKNDLQGTVFPGVPGTLNGQPTSGAFLFSGHNGLAETLWPTNYHGFEPRIGFAYAPTNFMTVRGAYSLIHTPLSGIGNSVVPDLASTALIIGNAQGGANPNAWVNYITNPVSIGSIPGTLTSGPLLSFSSSGYLPFVNQSDAVPYVQLWSFSLQFQAGSRTVIETSYSGQHGVHLFAPPVDVNVPPLNALLAGIAAHRDFNARTIANQFYPGTNMTLIESLRPYQQFYNNPILSAYDRTASSNYNGFYARVQHRAVAGLTLIGSFTWAKSMDNASSGSLDSTVTDVYGFSHPQIPYTLNGERSLSTFDIPVHVSGAYTWDLPIGKNRALNLHSGLLNDLLGGWKTSGIFSAQSGYPLWVVLGTPGYFISTTPGGKVGGLGTAIQDAFLRPNIVPGQPLVNPNWRSDPFGINGGGYLNPAAFAVPGSLDNPALGNAPRTLGGARNPRTIYYDLSVRKSFAIGERVRLQLRADAINALNHTNFFLGSGSSSQHTLTSSLNAATGQYTLNTNFGDISAVNGGRSIGLGIEITF